MVAVASALGVTALVLTTIYAIRWQSVNLIQRHCEESNSCGDGILYDTAFT